MVDNSDSYRGKFKKQHQAELEGSYRAAPVVRINNPVLTQKATGSGWNPVLQSDHR